VLEAPPWERGRGFASPLLTGHLRFDQRPVPFDLVLHRQDARELPQPVLGRHRPSAVLVLEVGEDLGRQVEQLQQLADPRPGQPLLGGNGGRVGDQALVDALAEAPRPAKVAQERPSAGGPRVLVGVVLVAGVEAHLGVARFGVARFR